MESTPNYDALHSRNLQRYAKKVEELYIQAMNEAAKIGVSFTEFNPNKPFSFDDYPVTKQKINSLINRLGMNLYNTILNGINTEWELSNNKNDELCKAIFGVAYDSLTKEQRRRYFSTNNKARQAFVERKTNGLNLSDNVWNYTNKFKDEIELALELGISQGKSADELSRDLRSYLKYPNKLFRRVKDENNELRLSKPARAFHPGQGVYRSSYKNARRLAVTETNIAYRTADHLRWQQLDFVVGIEIKTSQTNHPVPDICDDLKGKYPKDFKFTGWHPHCRCYATPILKTEDEVIEDNKKILEGGEPSGYSENSVDKLPDNFVTWVNGNKKRIKDATSLPYFVKDNFNYVDNILKTKPTAPYEPVTLETLRRQGYGVDFPTGLPETAYAESIARNFDFLSIKQQVHQALSDVGISVDSQDVNIWRKNRFSVYFAGRNKEGKEFRLERTFTDRGGNGIEVHHDLFTLPKSAQGKGTSKRILRMFYEEYKRMGVTKISVEANMDVGGYAWARYGFNAVDRAEAINAVCIREARNFIMDYYKKNGLSDNEPFPMYLLTEQPWGKDALLHGYWEGTLNFNNPTQVARFEKYLGLR